MVETPDEPRVFGYIGMCEIDMENFTIIRKAPGVYIVLVPLKDI